MKIDTKNEIETHRYASGQKLSEGLWMNGKKEGVWTEWYENGQIKSQESYKENVWHGKHNYWYESGQKLKESIDINGLYEGLWVTWHENGQKWEQGNYRKEKKEGLWTKWDENGQITSQENYKDGKLK
ncbi:hypothetical protein OAI40_02765 [Candidatus Pseudothioglobus singularis]|nr:hypothetical protein [Candidatus Pseudothioglobus singularis]MDB4598118.1 hypothetical protein [Candidatus Pseudothioglobus singularis]